MAGVSVWVDTDGVAYDGSVDLTETYYNKTYIDNVIATHTHKLSEQENDIGFITTADIPTKTSDLVNDSGFITSANVYNKTETYSKTEVDTTLGNYYKKTDTLPEGHTHTNKTVLDKLSESNGNLLYNGSQIATGAGDIDLSAYALQSTVNTQIDNAISTTKTWVEGKGYLTEHQSLTDYAKKSEIPSKMVASVTCAYAYGNNDTNVPTLWASSLSDLKLAPSTDGNTKAYLWEKQTTTYTDNTTSVSYYATITSGALASYATKTALNKKQDKLTAGDGISISDTGVISSTGGGGGSYTLPAATSSTLGGVKPDGTTTTVDTDGTIHANYTLPTASTDTLGGVKVDGTSVTITNGVISATASGNSSVSGYRFSSTKTFTDEDKANLIDALIYNDKTCIYIDDDIVIRKFILGNLYAMATLHLNGSTQNTVTIYTVAVTGSTMENNVQITSSVFSTFLTYYLVGSDTPPVNWNYTEDASDSNLSNATELYVSVSIDDNNKVPVYIRMSQNDTLGGYIDRHYCFTDATSSNVVQNCYISYNGSSVTAQSQAGGLYTINYIWYKL